MFKVGDLNSDSIQATKRPEWNSLHLDETMKPFTGYGRTFTAFINDSIERHWWNAPAKTCEAVNPAANRRRHLMKTLGSILDDHRHKKKNIYLKK